LKLYALTIDLLVYVLYPLWLVAGATDYWCHRRTKIALTSGAIETWLHIAQFVTIAIVFFGAVFLEPTLASIALLGTMVVLHLVLSYIDVAYTLPKRHISPLEQHVHGFLDVLPLVAVCLLAILGLSEPQSTTGFAMRSHDQATGKVAVLIGSFIVLAGIPVIEEHLRTIARTPSERKNVHAAHAEVNS
jgi:magnesium-transporting ATPase (P-type)